MDWEGVEGVCSNGGEQGDVGKYKGTYAKVSHVIAVRDLLHRRHYYYPYLKETYIHINKHSFPLE